MSVNGADQPATGRQSVTLVLGWAIIFALMSLVWSLPPLTGKLPDPDDYLRMERVFAILDSKHLPAYAAPGLGVGAAAETGWSRLVDWPVAAVQGVGEMFLPRLTAAMFTATLMPALALLCFIFAAGWYGRALKPGLGALSTLLAVLLLWGLLRQFMPGRVDHHMWQAVLDVIAYAALVRIYLTPERKAFPLLGGAAFGTGLAIGVDIIPALTFGTALLGLFWLVRGRAFERAGLLFGAALLSTACLWHVLLHDAGRLFAVYCDFLSPAWLALSAAVPAFWGLVYFLPQGYKAGWKGQLVCGAAVFAPLIVGLYLLFPTCFHDPYQISDPAVREIWLGIVSEAQPLPALWEQSRAAVLFFVLPPLLALVASLWAMRVEAEYRLLWGGLALVFVLALALTFYQVRTVDFAQAIAVGPLSWLILTLSRRFGAFIASFSLGRGQRLAAVSVFFILTLTLFIFALQGREERAVQPAQAGAMPCDVREAAVFLQKLPAPLTIAAHIDVGSELLFRTDHYVLAAPYHRNEQGILAAYNIFTARDEAAAHKAALAGGVDILLLCYNPEKLWMTGARGEHVFAVALASGEAPDWLTPLDDGTQAGGYLVFRVR